MKFLVDECVGSSVARYLKESGYDATSVFDEYRGIDDDTVLEIAIREKRIILTSDKDFGEKVFKEKLLHCGIVLLRLSDQKPSNQILFVGKLLHGYSNRLVGNFIVVTDKAIRFARVMC